MKHTVGSSGVGAALETHQAQRGQLADHLLHALHPQGLHQVVMQRAQHCQQI